MALETELGLYPTLTLGYCRKLDKMTYLLKASLLLFIEWGCNTTSMVMMRNAI